MLRYPTFFSFQSVKSLAQRVKGFVRAVKRGRTGQKAGRSAEWWVEFDRLKVRTDALKRHSERLLSYNHPPTAGGNCKGSWAIGTGCGRCFKCLEEAIILTNGPRKFVDAAPIDNPPDPAP